MRAVLPAVMIALVALAGCLEGDEVHDHPFPSNADPKDPESTSMDHEEDHEGEHEAEPEEEPGEEQEPEEGPANQAPTASLSASVQQGDLPVDVDFTINGADLDGDALTWTFDADGDGTVDAEGTELPADVTFTYDSEGEFTATATVDDGELSGSASVVITVQEAAPAEPLVTTQEFSGSWMLDNAGCVGGPYDPTESGEGLTHVTMAVEKGTWGLPFIAEMSGFDAFTMDLAFLDEAGTEIAFYSTADGGDFYTIDTAPGVPEGAATAIFFACLGIMPAVTYSAG